MPIDLDVTGDFDQLLDVPEALTLRRQGTESTAPIPARRFSAATSLPESFDATQIDVVWQFSWQDWSDPPRVGDQLADDSGHCWTILKIEQLAGNTRVRCTGRELRLLHGLNAWVDVQEAVWADQGSGLEIVDWKTVRPALPAKLKLTSTVVDRDVDPPTSSSTFRVTLGEPFPLDHNYRLVAADGTIYDVLEYRQAEEIDALPVAMVRRM